MTFSDLRKKDAICIGDGRLLGRVTDLELDERGGCVRALIIAGACSFAGFFHADKSLITVPFGQVACIGDDVILVSDCTCR